MIIEEDLSTEIMEQIAKQIFKFLCFVPKIIWT